VTKRAKDLANYIPEDKLSFRDLLDSDRAMICNGCGGKGSWIKPPDWLFKASCDHHDFEYWRGGTAADRVHADWGFYTAMIEDANRAPWWRRPFAKTRAWFYYRAVRAFASSYFHHGYQRGKRALADLRETARLRNEDQA